MDEKDNKGDTEVNEVNVLDELLENADDDDLTAELNNEERKQAITVKPSVKSKVKTKITKPSAKTPSKLINSKITKSSSQSFTTKKSSTSSKMSAKPSVQRVNQSKAESAVKSSSKEMKVPQKSPVKVKSTKSSTTSTKAVESKANVKSESIKASIKSSNSAKSISSLSNTKEKVSHRLKSELTKTVKKVNTKTTSTTTTPSTTTTVTTKKTVPKVVKKVSEKKPTPKLSSQVSKTSSKIEKETTKTAATSKTATTSKDVAKDKSPTNKEQEQEESDVDKLHVMVAADELTDEIQNAAQDDVGTGIREPEAGGGSEDQDFDTRSEASSSAPAECSCSCEEDRNSSVMSSSDSASRSPSHSLTASRSGSETGGHKREKKEPRSRKRTHSPIVYDRKGGSAESKYFLLIIFTFLSCETFSLISLKVNEINTKIFGNNTGQIKILYFSLQGVWSTPPQNEARLNQAFRESKNVILIFSVKESGKFQGKNLLFLFYKFITNEATKYLIGNVYSHYSGYSHLARRELPFTKTQHLYNPWNEGKQVKIGRDGQEVEPKVGEELCRLFPVDENIDLVSILHRIKRNKVRHSSRTTRDIRHRERHREHREHSSRRSPHDSLRRRRRHESYDIRSSRSKHSRHDFHEAYFKELSRDRSSLDRYLRRDIMNGEYADYMREFHHQRPPLPPLPFGAPPSYGLEPPPYYERTLHHPDFMSLRPRPMDKRAYERSVDDFLRRTARPPSRPDRRYRDHL
ncbi:YTH domain-containing protein 1-like [Centruroides sculpturatus]|uniref:YTH domain-containing protein 1-like n=1 Tax=Centruroides sculpturatus TaxID=218467 RepID=UPI000C6E331C|nr:YTH domain-containing protein 1-like [Centruroides sculpturatus]